MFIFRLIHPSLLFVQKCFFHKHFIAILIQYSCMSASEAYPLPMFQRPASLALRQSEIVSVDGSRDIARVTQPESLNWWRVCVQSCITQRSSQVSALLTFCSVPQGPINGAVAEILECHGNLFLHQNKLDCLAAIWQY